MNGCPVGTTFVSGSCLTTCTNGQVVLAGEADCACGRDPMFVAGSSCNAGVISIPNCNEVELGHNHYIHNDREKGPENIPAGSCKTCVPGYIRLNNACSLKCTELAIFQASSSHNSCVC